jgi:branched-chain amino acid transport system ATP-binding protein
MSLSVHDAWVAYHGVDVLKGVSFELKPSGSLAVCGPNGMGKSTLLKTITGQVPAGKGTIKLNGEEITSLPVYLIVRKGISLVPEGRQILTQLTVEENLQLGGYTLDSAARKSMTEQVLPIFPILKERVGQLAGTLSGGEQQLLAIARALMSGNRYLLIDEPFLGLSPANIEIVSATLSDINRSGVAILVADEDVLKVSGIVRDIFILDNGVLTKCN